MCGLAAGCRSARRRLRNETAETARLQQDLDQGAVQDSPTGLAERGRLEQEIAREMARAERRNDPLCLIALGFEESGEIGDQNGRPAGNDLLTVSAGMWSRSLRAGDLLARVGTRKFVAVLPDCSPTDAWRVTERLQRKLPMAQTASTEAVCWDRRESAPQLLARVDDALHHAETRNAQGRLDASSFTVVPA